MTSFGNPKHMKKNLECAWQHLGSQISFGSKLSFIQ
jgi:hypothetical protein